MKLHVYKSIQCWQRFCNICTSPKVNTLLKQNTFIDLCVFVQSEQNIVASFDRKGEYIYTGNSKGKVSDDVTNKRCGMSVAESRF